MKSEFDKVLNEELERYQRGGFLIGDRVKFTSNVLNHDYFKEKGQSFRDMIQACCDQGFDLNLRIGALKSIWPTTTQNYQGGTEAPDNIYADVYIEYAPGLYRNPMTVPIEVIELQDDGNNRGPVPDSLKRPNPSQEITKAQTTIERPDKKDNISNPQTNTPLPNANKWDDSKPGAGNVPKTSFQLVKDNQLKTPTN